MTQVRIRHKCETRLLAKVNKNLTEAQKSRINATPFKWLLRVPDELQISGKLLYELASRWVESNGGFRIRNLVVPFSPLDVCFALGLRIVGQNVTFDEDHGCHTSSLFKGKEISTSNIVEQLTKLHKNDSVDDFCRLYILLGFVQFYFPKTKGSVHGSLLRLLDDLDSLDKYNWGAAVYEFLVNSLSRASIKLTEAKNAFQLHITGCAALLQVWAWDHLLICKEERPTSLKCFPRFLNWQNLKISGMKISSAFKCNLIVIDLVATKEELQHEVVREAMHKAPTGFPHWHQRNSEIMNGEDLYQLLVAKNKKLYDRVSLLEDEIRMIKQLLEPETTSMSQMEDRIKGQIKEKKLKVEEKQFENQVKELKSKQKKPEGRVKEHKSKVEEFEGRVNDLESRKKDFEHQVKELESNANKFEVNRKELKSKEKQLEEIDGQVKELETIEKQFQQVLDNIDNNCESKEEELEALLKKIVECTKELKTKEEEIDAKQKLIDGQAKELESERKKLHKVMSIRNSQCAEVKDFESMKKQFEGKVKELESNEKQFEEQVKEFESKEKYFEGRVKEHESKEKQLEGRVKELQSKEKHFEGQVKEFKSKERQLEERAKELGSKENMFDEQVKGLNSEKKQLEGQVKELKFKEKQFEEKVKERQSKEKLVEGQLKDLESKQNQFEGQLKELELKEKQYEALIKFYEEKVFDDQSSEETEERGLLDNDILVNLQASSDPSKLVLDIIQNPFAPRCSKGDNTIIIDDSQIFLLEQLMRISPHIKPHVSEEAMKLVLHLKANTRPCNENSLAALGLLMLLQIYGLVSSVDEDEVLKLFEVAAQHKQAVELFQTVGFADKVSDFVQNLIKKQQHLGAVRFICAYKLADKNHAVYDLLQEHVQNVKLISDSMCKESNNMEIKDKARDQEIASLRGVLKCISENNLQYEDLLNDIRVRILELYKQKASSVYTGSRTITC